MAIRVYKPTTAGRRNASVSDFSELTRTTPEKSLVRKLSKTGGRNSYGRMTSRHRGGGHKRQYRLIDFKRWDKDGVPAKVAHIEYDPNRTARIALLHYADGEKRYIIAPEGIKQGDTIETGEKADIKPGNNLPLKNIPTGTIVHAIELRPLGGAKIAGAESNGRVFIKPRSGGECERPAGEWNCAEIVCVGDHIAVCVNGVLQNECTGSVRSGYIALQSEGGPVEFRNIWLTRLRRGI